MASSSFATTVNVTRLGSRQAGLLPYRIMCCPPTIAQSPPTLARSLKGAAPACIFIITVNFRPSRCALRTSATTYILKHIYMMSLESRCCFGRDGPSHVTKGTAESCDTFDSCKEATPRSLIRSHTFLQCTHQRPKSQGYIPLCHLIDCLAATAMQLSTAAAGRGTPMERRCVCCSGSGHTRH